MSGNPGNGNPARGPYRYWHLVQVWNSDEILSKRWNPASLDDQAHLLERSRGRTPLVCIGMHYWVTFFWKKVLLASPRFDILCTTLLDNHQGNTNANDLAAKDIHIWDGNGSREFLDSRGLTDRQVGDLGPVYGFQWRHFGAKYTDMHTDYTGQGVDQLAECIHKIIHNPEDRRIIMSAWNPADLNQMALPPCHMFCQFYVDTHKNEVSCQMYQRSADMGLGVPFNIASYALLTHMVAHITGRKPGDFIHTIGDAHIYLNHVDALKEQLQREPRAFPKLKINPDKKNIDHFSFEDFEVIGYNPHKTIKMKMAV
jgi:dihydrofolate reductase / thymidylate synthase